MSMTADELAEAQAREYGTYVAKEPIFINGARAFNTGDPVPASHVENEIVSKDAVDVVKIDVPGIPEFDSGGQVLPADAATGSQA